MDHLIICHFWLFRALFDFATVQYGLSQLHSPFLPISADLLQKVCEVHRLLGFMVPIPWTCSKCSDMLDGMTVGKMGSKWSAG